VEARDVLLSHKHAGPLRADITIKMGGGFDLSEPALHTAFRVNTHVRLLKNPCKLREHHVIHLICLRHDLVLYRKTICLIS
jgi:hypothetical protein